MVRANPRSKPPTDLGSPSRSQIPMPTSGDCSESSMNRVRITCTRRRTFTKSSCRPRFVGRYFTRR